MTPPVRILKEDEIKRVVVAYLEAAGYTVTSVAWGKTRGVDIEAIGPEGRILLEVKGDAPTPQMQGNYFLGALGELVQRMDDPTATYGLVLPDNRRFRGLVDRLPDEGRKRLRLLVLFVRLSDVEGRAGRYRVEPDAWSRAHLRIVS